MSLSQSDRKWIEGPKPRRKPRKQTVFVLEGIVHYEQGTILGVYSTQRKAEKARDEFIVAKGSQPDEYQIGKHVVNA